MDVIAYGAKLIRRREGGQAATSVRRAKPHGQREGSRIRQSVPTWVKKIKRVETLYFDIAADASLLMLEAWSKLAQPSESYVICLEACATMSSLPFASFAHDLDE